MAESKKLFRRRARTEDGHFKADDPSTPDVNEAWEEVEKKPAKKTAKAKPKAAPAKAAEAPKKAEDEVVWFESRNQEPSMFMVAGINPIRNFSNGRLEFKVKKDDVERFSRNHFVMTGRVVKKA